jgi:hypothetical protein
MASIDEPDCTSLEIAGGARDDGSSYGVGRLAAIHDALGDGREGRGSVVDGSTVVGSMAGGVLDSRLASLGLSLGQVDGRRRLIAGLDVVDLGGVGSNERLVAGETGGLAREGGSGGDGEEPRSCCPVQWRHYVWVCVTSNSLSERPSMDGIRA